MHTIPPNLDYSCPRVDQVHGHPSNKTVDQLRLADRKPRQQKLMDYRYSTCTPTGLFLIDLDHRRYYSQTISTECHIYIKIMNKLINYTTFNYRYVFS